MIEISNLTKRYGKFVALHDIELSIEGGRLTGVIGPNGSGKSTLIKSLLGLVSSASGKITINGHTLDGSAEYRKELGYVPQIARFPQDLKGREIISAIKGLRTDKAILEQELIQRFDLERELDKRVRAMSGGTRQKLSVVIACMYDPAILIFDEPTAGLDPLANTRLMEYLTLMKARGRTILLTTHIMNDLEELADNVIVLLDGRIHFSGPARRLKQQTDEQRLDLAVARLVERGAA